MTLKLQKSSQLKSPIAQAGKYGQTLQKALPKVFKKRKSYLNLKKLDDIEDMTLLIGMAIVGAASAITGFLVADNLINQRNKNMNCPLYDELARMKRANDHSHGDSHGK